MKTRHLLMAAAAMTFACSHRMAAQSTNGSANATNSTLQSISRVTVTGCLQSADQASSHPTGGASAGASAGARPSISNRSSSASSTITRFMLTGAASAGSASTTRSDSPRAAGTYVLEGQSAELRLHLNQQVEITGHVSSSYSSSGSASSSASGQRLNVASVRTISTNCAR